MITLKKLRWSNVFSYGEANEIDFLKNPLTQLVGANGYGKSSIALILEEVLYNKNSKNVKKSDIINRNTKAKSYTIELEFDKDKDNFVLTTTRGSTQTVKLVRNGIDISSHTATSTYALVQALLGYDHKTFSQIVYQSSVSSLEFLTATDGNRKKFLIDLLNLSQYLELGETFKSLLKDLNDKVLTVNTKIDSIKTWKNKYSDVSLEKIELKTDIPNAPRDLIEKISSIKEQINNITTLNKKIVQNNKYKELRDAIIINTTIPKPSADVNTFNNEIAVCKAKSTELSKYLKHITSLGNVCPTCSQNIDTNLFSRNIEDTEKQLTNIAAEKAVLENLKDVYLKELALWQAEEDRKLEYEKYHNLYDPKLEQTIYSKEGLQEEIVQLEKEINLVNKEISEITEFNNKALAHNTKIDLILQQREEMDKDLESLSDEQITLLSKQNIYQYLVKTFSATGLVAYKIECLIKDLEEITNKYLLELSSGRFQLYFKIVSSDKLNVVITDNSKDVDINSLSSGEKARVNVSALLGIRRLMQSLSNNRINLLILDETIENLDIEGKEKLIDILLQEEFLNTFIISHSFHHPLLERIHIVKDKNISRIEDGR